MGIAKMGLGVGLWIVGGVAVSAAATPAALVPFYREGWRDNPSQSLTLSAGSPTSGKRDVLPGEELKAGDQIQVPAQLAIWLALGSGFHLLVPAGTEFVWSGPGAPISLIKGEAYFLSDGMSPDRVVETPSLGVQSVPNRVVPFEVWLEVGPKSSIVSTLQGSVQAELREPAVSTGIRGAQDRYREVRPTFQVEGVHSPQKWNRLVQFSPSLLRLNWKERYPGLIGLLPRVSAEMPRLFPRSAPPSIAPVRDASSAPVRSRKSERVEAADEPVVKPVKRKPLSPEVKKQRQRLKEHQTEGETVGW